MLIDGEWVSATDNCWFDSYEPGTGEVWARVAAATEVDVDRAVRAADRAMHSGPWSKMTASERGEALGRLGELVGRHATVLAEAETRDTGKLIRETAGSVAYVPAFYRYYGGLADKIQGHTLPSDKPGIEI
ncbi:MAG TPA: carnitine dehydratase, partial [Acidimicrobiaceae bacterium]|nr:carnitine dehydratase [Acidimicrobiaceae bacterium]